MTWNFYFSRADDPCFKCFECVCFSVVGFILGVRLTSSGYCGFTLTKSHVHVFKAVFEMLKSLYDQSHVGSYRTLQTMLFLNWRIILLKRNAKWIYTLPILFGLIFKPFPHLVLMSWYLNEKDSKEGPNLKLFSFLRVIRAALFHC